MLTASMVVIRIATISPGKSLFLTGRLGFFLVHFIELPRIKNRLFWRLSRIKSQNCAVCAFVMFLRLACRCANCKFWLVLSVAWTLCNLQSLLEARCIVFCSCRSALVFVTAPKPIESGIEMPCLGAFVPLIGSFFAIRMSLETGLARLWLDKICERSLLSGIHGNRCTKQTSNSSFKRRVLWQTCLASLNYTSNRSLYDLPHSHLRSETQGMHPCAQISREFSDTMSGTWFPWKWKMCSRSTRSRTVCEVLRTTWSVLWGS